MEDLACRLRNRVQLTTDGNYTYLRAVDRAFRDGIDYAVLQKLYGKDTTSAATRLRSASAPRYARC
jgi:hypothetical protein